MTNTTDPANAVAATSYNEQQRAARDLQHALNESRNDARLTQLAEHHVSDAKFRLQHVLELTDAAAHRALDLVEYSIPLAERTVALLKDHTELTEPSKVVIARLVAISGNSESRRTVSRVVDGTALLGPTVPGVAMGAMVGAQGDVDDLLTGLGL